MDGLLLSRIVLAFRPAFERPCVMDLEQKMDGNGTSQAGHSPLTGDSLIVPHAILNIKR